MKYFAKFFTPRNLLVSAIVAQILFFALFAFLSRGSWLRGDNYLYETPAWNFASGNGHSLNRNEWEDPYLTELYYSKHPEKAGDEFIPATTLPVGYSYFLGTIYTVFGRNHLAAIIFNLILLCITIWLMYLIARRAFGDKAELYFTICLIGVFPFYAFWATVIMSDTLHLLLLTLFAFVFFVDEISFKRVLISGIILGLAATVRPYVTLLPVALLLGGLIFGCKTFNLKNTLTVAVLCFAVLSCWALKNYYEFGKPMLTSMGLGHGVWLGAQREYFSSEMTEEESWQIIRAAGVGDIHRNAENRRLLEVALEQIKERPFHYSLATLTSMPRLRISTGGPEAPFSRKLISTFGFGLLFFLTLIGGFLARKYQNPVLIGGINIICYYTLIFAPLNNEGRYVIPARFFSFLLISVAIAHFLRLYFPRFFSSEAAAVQ